MTLWTFSSMPTRPSRAASLHDDRQWLLCESALLLSEKKLMLRGRYRVARVSLEQEQRREQEGL